VPELEELPLEEPLPLLEPPEGGLVGRLKPELPELPPEEPLLEPPEGGLVGRLKPELPELPELPGSGGR